MSLQRKKVEEDIKLKRINSFVMSSCNITTLQVWDTIYSADSAEWCPVIPYQNVFVCGTYFLVENDCEREIRSEEETCISGETQNKCEQKKIGSLHLFVIDQSLVTHKIQTIDLDAVLDSKWCHKKVGDKTLLAVATAKGEVLMFELSEDDDSPEETQFLFSLKLLTKIKISQVEVLALSLDWLVNKCDDTIANQALVVVSNSKGGVSLLRLLDSTLILTDHWEVHEYEAWIAAFDYWNSSIMFSGGDDNKFTVLDSRADHNPVLVNKSHDMGVTSIHCNYGKEHSLVSGSYDEKLRFWDTRNLKKPISTLKLIGGIWRLKWSPHNFEYLLAACMYGGFCIVNAKDVFQPEIVSIYKEHNSLAYGCDWSYWTDIKMKQLVSNTSLQESRKTSLITTCSFYDHKLCVSVFDELKTTIK